MKRNNWFMNYHTVNGKKGLREINTRNMYFLKTDFENKNIIDIGCNTGQMLIYSYDDMSCNYGLGIEYDVTAVKGARENCNGRNIDIICDDIDNYFVFTNFKEKFNTCLLLSVIDTIELENRYGMLAKLSSICDVMYLEGHNNSKYDDLMKAITNYTIYSRIEFKGMTYDNQSSIANTRGRHFFRLSNEDMNIHEAISKIKELLQNEEEKINIACIGFGGVGKTNFKNVLIQDLQSSYDIKKHSEKLYSTARFHVLDDEPNILKYSDKSIILFDYNAMKILNGNIHTIFYFKYNIDQRFNNRPENYSYMKSKPFIKYNFTNIYHINTY